MLLLILAIIIATIATIASINLESKQAAAITLAVGWLIAIITFSFNCHYRLDVGEVAVIQNWGGSMAGSQSEAGFHGKAPWQKAIKFDTRNNLINFYGSTDFKVKGGSEDGKQVTINDKSGAKADIDIQVNYSLNPEAAEKLYEDYGTQENFVEKYVKHPANSTR